MSGYPLTVWLLHGVYEITAFILGYCVQYSVFMSKVRGTNIGKRLYFSFEILSNGSNVVLYMTPLYTLRAIHKLRHTNLMIFLTPPPSLSQVVTFLSEIPPTSVTSHILQFYT